MRKKETPQLRGTDNVEQEWDFGFKCAYPLVWLEQNSKHPLQRDTAYYFGSHEGVHTFYSLTSASHVDSYEAWTRRPFLVQDHQKHEGYFAVFAHKTGSLNFQSQMEKTVLDELLELYGLKQPELDEQEYPKLENGKWNYDIGQRYPVVVGVNDQFPLWEPQEAQYFGFDQAKQEFIFYSAEGDNTVTGFFSRTREPYFFPQLNPSQQDLILQQRCRNFEGQPFVRAHERKTMRFRKPIHKQIILDDLRKNKTHE